MKLARLALMLFLMASWAAAQSGAPAAADDKGKADSAATADHKHGEPAAMSCGCCKDMAKKDAAKPAMDCCAKMNQDKDAAGGMSCAKMGKDKDAAAGMGCCAKMDKDKDASAGGMSCGKKDDAAKPATPEQKMK